MSDNMSDKLPIWRIAGQDFTPDEIRHAAENSRLLTVELETSYACNLRCTYCYASAGDKRDNEMSPSDISRVLAEARALGARRVVLLGGGEPLLYERFRSLVDEIAGLGMAVEVFTNGTLIDAETARFLYEREVAVVVKRNSADPDVQDALTGVVGSARQICQGLENLFEAGYPAKQHPLAVQTVICRENLDEIEDLWRWARSRRIEPYFECMTMQGRAMENGLEVTTQETRAVFELLSRIDREENGIDWVPRPPLAGAACKRHSYSILIKANGIVSPCVGIDIAVGDIRRQSLAEIISGSRVVQELRNVQRLLHGPCGDCTHNSDCYGCRGNAYQVTGDYLASDPGCWMA